MKVSEAIREGAGFYKQGIDRLVHQCQGEWHVCAWGSAMIHVLECPPERINPLSDADWDFFSGALDVDVNERIPLTLPIPYAPKNWDEESLWWKVVRLNDDLRWSREQIADYLEQHGL